VSTDAGALSAYSLATRQQIWSVPFTPEVPPVVGEDLIFAAAGSTVHALEQSSGHERWRAETGPLVVAPTWRVGWLFASSKDGSLSAWRVSDGSKVWQQSLGSPASAPIAIDGNRIFVPLADSRLVALDVETGGSVWSIPLDEVGGTPLAAGDRIYLGGSNYAFYSIFEADGAIEWQHRLIRSTVIGHPVMDDRYVWIATLNNRVAALSRGNGEIEWMLNLRARPAEQLILDGGQVIVPLSSGELDVFDERDGKPMPSPTGSSGTAARAGGGAAPASAPAPGAPLPPGAVAAGTRLIPPLVLAGPEDAPLLLRVTLGSDDVLTVTAFQRDTVEVRTFPGIPVKLSTPPAAR
jgi:outer membrane protein assembly factor BamB